MTFLIDINGKLSGHSATFGRGKDLKKRAKRKLTGGIVKRAQRRSLIGAAKGAATNVAQGIGAGTVAGALGGAYLLRTRGKGLRGVAEGVGRGLKQVPSGLKMTSPLLAGGAIVGGIQGSRNANKKKYQWNGKKGISVGY